MKDILSPLLIKWFIVAFDKGCFIGYGYGHEFKEIFG